MQMSPIAVLRYAHGMHRCVHQVGGALQCDGEALRAVGPVDDVAVMAMAQGEARFVAVHIHLLRRHHGGVASHAAGSHTPHHNGSPFFKHHLSGFALLKILSQRMLCSRGLSGSNEIITNIG